MLILTKSCWAVSSKLQDQLFIYQENGTKKFTLLSVILILLNE